jgi:hypothetical protein
MDALHIPDDYAEPISFEFNLALNPVQLEVLLCGKRFRVWVAGRRTGKTHEAIAELIVSAAKFAGSNNWYVAPTRVQAKDVIWEDLKNIIPPEWVRRVYEGELTIVLKNGSRISLKGAENYQKLRGRKIKLVVLDEFADMHPGVWTVIRPQLGDEILYEMYGEYGRCLFIGTPRGFNHLYDRYQRAVAGVSAKGTDISHKWQAFHHTSIQGGNLSQAEIDEAMEDLSERDFRQEYMASFEALAGRIYHSFVHADFPKGNVDKSIEDDKTSPILVGLDFNVNPMSATIGQKRTVDGIMESWTFDEIQLHDSHTLEMAQVIRKRFEGRTVVTFPDPSARNRGTVSAKAGETDISILKGQGLQVYVPSGNYGLSDRYNTTNGLLLNAKGVRRKKIHPRCQNLIKGYDGFCYKEGTNLPDKEGGLDHMTDAEGYKDMGAFPMRSAVTVAYDAF